MAVPVTNCQFENSTGITFKLDGQMFWHGTGTPPQTFSASAEFVHTGDEEGSIGALSYILGDQAFAKWIVAWSNKSSGSENRVYTAILGGKDPVIWDDIYNTLVTTGKPSDTAHGYKSELKIDEGTMYPNMVAQFSKATTSA